MNIIGPIVEWLVIGIDLIAVCVLAWGVVLGLWSFLRREWLRVLKGPNLGPKDDTLRGQLGSYLLLALEFMIASDIIYTLISRTYADLIFLAGIVALRTLMGYLLSRELNQVSSLATPKRLK